MVDTRRKQTAAKQLSTLANLKSLAVAKNLISHGRIVKTSDRPELLELLASSMQMPGDTANPAESPDADLSPSLQPPTEVTPSAPELNLQAVHAMSDDIQRLQVISLARDKEYADVCKALHKLQEDLARETAQRMMLQEEVNELKRKNSHFETLRADEELARKLQHEDSTSRPLLDSRGMQRQPASLAGRASVPPPPPQQVHPEQKRQKDIELNLRLTGFRPSSEQAAEPIRTQVVSFLSETLHIPISRLSIQTADIAPSKSSHSPPTIHIRCSDLETKMRILRSKSMLRKVEGKTYWVESQLTIWQQGERRRKQPLLLRLRLQGRKAFFEDHRLMSFVNGTKQEIFSD